MNILKKMISELDENDRVWDQVRNQVHPPVRNRISWVWDQINSSQLPRVQDPWLVTEFLKESVTIG